MSEPTNTENVTVNCKADELKSSINAMVAETGGVLAVTLKLDSKIQSVATQMEEIYKIVKHLHDSHYHPYPHEARDEYDVDLGAPVFPQIYGPCDRLIAEYNNNMDFDMNGLIYGFDFIIDPNDSQKPLILNDIDKTICESRYNMLSKLSWSDFISTLPDEIYARDRSLSK